jgi:hypothetical protein
MCSTGRAAESPPTPNSSALVGQISIQAPFLLQRAGSMAGKPRVAGSSSGAVSG